MPSIPSAPSEREHLPELDSWWADGALRAIAVLAESGATFSSDDLRDEPYSIPEPSHPSQWGALFAHAKHAEIIEHVGFTISRTPSRRGGVLRTWTARQQRPAIAE